MHYLGNPYRAEIWKLFFLLLKLLSTAIKIFFEKYQSVVNILYWRPDYIFSIDYSKISLAF